MKNLLISLKLTLVLAVLLGMLYPALLALIAKGAPGHGKGITLSVNGKLIGYENIGQKFTEDKYFWGRPSAVDYNAAGSAGSNKGPSNPDYLAVVQARIDTFLIHNPGVRKQEIPSDLVTASGSGLDPDISVDAAKIQIGRIARVRRIDEKKIRDLVNRHIEPPFLGLFGPARINVLKLNRDLDELAMNPKAR